MVGLLSNLTFHAQKPNLSNDTISSEISIDSLHFPKKSALFSAIIPGTGQIYNNHFKPENKKSKLWWKLPIIYGALGASVYSTIFYQREYKIILDERKARLVDSYIPQIHLNYTSDQLYTIQESYRKNRDYSIIAGLLVYVLNIIDANVEGHLIHFDSSDNLSFKLTPNYSTYNSTAQVGAKLTLNFR